MRGPVSPGVVGGGMEGVVWVCKGPSHGGGGTAVVTGACGWCCWWVVRGLFRLRGKEVESGCVDMDTLGCTPGPSVELCACVSRRRYCSKDGCGGGRQSPLRLLPTAVVIPVVSSFPSRGLLLAVVFWVAPGVSPVSSTIMSPASFSFGLERILSTAASTLRNKIRNTTAPFWASLTLTPNSRNLRKPALIAIRACSSVFSSTLLQFVIIIADKSIHGSNVKNEMAYIRWRCWSINLTMISWHSNIFRAARMISFLHVSRRNK